MDKQLLQDFGEFLRLRERVLKLIQANLGSDTFGKGYEGILQLTFPSMIEAQSLDKTYTIAFESQVISLGRLSWSGSTLLEAVSKVNKDIDLWYEENSSRQSDGSDNSGA